MLRQEETVDLPRVGTDASPNRVRYMLPAKSTTLVLKHT